MKNCYIIVVCVSLVFSHNLFSAENKTVTQPNVINQMNYCVNTLTNIIHNKSMPVLDHEADQIINNLTMEQITGLDDIKEFRTDLLDGISKFEITEEERSLLRRIQSIKRDNMKWSALSNALNPTMLLTGGAGPGMGYQMAFNALLTAARSVVEYKTMQGEQNIEELQAMWDLRKEDLEGIALLRNEAYNIVWQLYNKYGLKEYDRLTEASATKLCDILAEQDAMKRIRLLEDNLYLFKNFYVYYYHLGMAYYDLKQYGKAEDYFNIYLNLYSANPILRYDERSGCIALAMLSYKYYASNEDKLKMIQTAVSNLPGNSAALLQCAMVYIHELKQVDKGLDLIRAGLDDIHATDKDVLFMAAANLMPLYAKYPSLKQAVCASFNNATALGFDSQITYLFNTSASLREGIGGFMKFGNLTSRSWYSLWFSKKLNKAIDLELPTNIRFTHNDVTIYKEIHDEDNVTVIQINPKYKNCITEEDIEDVECFKANKNLKYLYVEEIAPNVYKLKKNIDLKKIKDGNWPRQSEYTLSEGDVEDIADFCEDYLKKPSDNTIVLEEYDSDFKKMKSAKGLSLKFKGESLRVAPHHTKAQIGVFYKFILRNGIQLVFKFNESDSELYPYYFIKGTRITFVDPNSKREYFYVEKAQEDASPWYDIFGWFSSDKNDNEEKQSNEKQEVSTETESAWYDVFGWFSSDNDSEEEQKDGSSEKVEKKTDVKDSEVEEGSHWYNFFGLFQAESKVREDNSSTSLKPESKEDKKVKKEINSAKEKTLEKASEKKNVSKESENEEGELKKVAKKVGKSVVSTLVPVTNIVNWFADGEDENKNENEK